MIAAVAYTHGARMDLGDLGIGNPQTAAAPIAQGDVSS